MCSSAGPFAGRREGEYDEARASHYGAALMQYRQIGSRQGEAGDLAWAELHWPREMVTRRGSGSNRPLHCTLPTIAGMILHWTAKRWRKPIA